MKSAENVSAGDSATAPAPPTLHEALTLWLKLGLVSFGGPAGQIALMHRWLVEERWWISERRFLHALNYCMLLPGPEAQQLATYLGWLLHRTWGGIAAGVLFVLPSLLLLIGLSWVYMAYGDQPVIAGLFYGIKPAVTAIVAQAALRIGSRTLRNNGLRCIAAAAFTAIFLFAMPFPAIVLAAALIGWMGARLAPCWFATDTAAGTAQAPNAPSKQPAVIDDDTPTLPHARFSLPRLLRLGAVGALLWSLPMLALTASVGWGGTLTRMAWFFTKAALLTFGGAYAVLPYVFQGAVDRHGWLTAAQMIDGLALGETTPGPLIMVVSFVGFVGGYTGELFGPHARFAAGAAAAIVVTWFTFLPSFLFIFAGGPLVESTHGNLKFTAPLVAITAAVVGVIVNLAVFFGLHVLWPRGTTDSVDWAAAAILLLAAIALIGFKRGVIEIIFLSALIGLVVTAAFR